MHKAYDELPALVEKHNVDVLCLQECKPEDISPVIGGLKLKRSDVAALSLARSDPLGELGLAMYVRGDRWLVVRDTYSSLPNALYERAMRAPDRTRLQMLELESLENKGVRTVAANTHIAHLAASGTGRRNQAVQAAKMTLTFANGLPIVLSGDFNHPFADEKLVKALEQTGLKHATGTNGRLITYKKWPRRTFDRMFFEGMELKSIEVLPFGDSDHAPIVGRFEIGDRGKEAVPSEAGIYSSGYYTHDPRSSRKSTPLMLGLPMLSSYNGRGKKFGKIIIPHGVDVWHHELLTADALAGAGYTVEFLNTDGVRYAKSPDIVMDNERWEMKSPKTDKLSAVERNLKRATKQSGNIIIDSHRMSKIHDKSVQKLLIQKYKQQKTIKKLLFVNRKRQVIDISKLI